MDPDESCMKVPSMAVLEETRDSLSGHSPCHNFMKFESYHAHVFLFSCKTHLGQTQKKGNVVWRYELPLSEKLIMPCHKHVGLTQSIEAVSGDNCCVSMQLGCLPYKCPPQRCPTCGGSSEFLGMVQISPYLGKITFPISQVNSEAAFLPRKR